jgi:hypothetical protein
VIPVQFRAAANQEIAEAVNWYESQRPGLGSRFFEDLDHVLSRIEGSREQFPSVYRNAHRALLRRFPFGVFFTKYEDRTLVIAVVDLRREPSKWRSRI